MIESDTFPATWQKRVRRWIYPLRCTPLHPQWLVLRHERKAMEGVAAVLSGLVLDIGCADGRLRNYLRGDARYLGLDYPATALDLYATRPDVFADAQNRPFGGEGVESIAPLDVLERLPSAAAAIAEIGRVLKPGGMLALQVPFMYPLHDAPFDFHRWTHFGLRKLLTDNGLVVVQEEFYGQPLETSAVIANIALARTVVRLLAARNAFALILGLAAALLIPLRNLVGFLFASLGGRDEMMPFGYRVFCRKVL